MRILFILVYSMAKLSYKNRFKIQILTGIFLTSNIKSNNWCMIWIKILIMMKIPVSVDKKYTS